MLSLGLDLSEPPEFSTLGRDAVAIGAARLAMNGAAA